MKESVRKLVFRMFAQGKTPDQVAELCGDPDAGTSHNRISLRQAERLFVKYLALPIGEKLRVTLMPECVFNRTHRLMDDIADLTLVDKALLGVTDEKALESLLDIKRKIKERMSKEHTPAAESSTGPEGKELEHELEEKYTEIDGS